MSLFAQELGTAEPVSAVRLERVLAELGRANPAAAKAMADRPDVPVRRDDPPYLKPSTATSKKSAKLKSLGALDRLFRQ